MNVVSTLPQPRSRQFLPEEFKVTVWSRLKPYYQELLKRPIQSLRDLENWILDKSELDAVVSEAFSWRYISITVDSSDQKAAELYQYSVEELAPKITSFENALNKKLVACPFLDKLDPERYGVFVRSVRNEVTLHREENIPLATDIQIKAKEYVKIFSEMTIGVNGKQMTLQKASSMLEKADRGSREAVYHKIHRRILQDTEQLEDLFDELLVSRHAMARNAGFDNFRDFKFQALGRFDYSVSDCLDFHDSIITEIVPIVNELNYYRRESLGVDRLRPWDLFVDPSGEMPLSPCEEVDDLIKKVAQCLREIHPTFGRVLEYMQTMGHLDLESRPGKRPGGYNMPLHLTGVPFIFMNATNSFSDLRTLIHESGHAIHSYLTRHYPLRISKRVPSEVAELAAMSMELLSLEHWDIFFDNRASLRRAKISQLEHVLKVLPWIATIDKFQHWLYTQADHSHEERKQNWKRIFREFSSEAVDHSGLEHYLDHLWHKQLHIFEVPFYYIEYGMAQLGAIAIWKRFQQEPDRAVKDYIRALKLGYTRNINQIYEAAGIRFDFSREYVRELGLFIKGELKALLEEERREQQMQVRAAR